MAIFFTALAMWAAAGVIIAAILARHGHVFWVYAAMGLAYGPLLLLVWLEGVRGQGSRSIVIGPTKPASERGWIDVLVGLDASPDAVESARQVLATLGSSIRRVRLVSAVDHEILNSPGGFETDDERLHFLAEAAQSLSLDNAELALVSGQPAKALSDHAVEHSFDLLIVANRRHLVVSGLRGSTVGRLARNAEIPVLIGPPA